ncbi:RNA polymerase sigma factor [Streptomyces scabiei]|uniref:RNA polymerase sigma factor n=7 Tax=Streptomyces scabiei TaxID=1930 RepID=UPI0029B09613|nr:RNA polymerase sigma factor [Streptomyces scabiei]MDX2534681.1 RNA polymerase sigma factor [Streptomyces scabiei]MDX2796189.1 RNA polymerase sigma factor [Streptomyces scabiei]MDX2860393.1 RNA polymerase sigma factor [Streptomyces scabiei]MDX3825386.1 RNA polymerase sigma factor [Streptomyces scabiei]
MSDPERAGAEAETSVRARIRAGDRETFAEVYDAYARAVYNHAYRLTGDWSTAEEVMADTFLDAWRTRRRLEPDGGSVKPWLLGMATNKARNANRGLGRRLAFLARRPAPAPVPDFADETAGRLDDARRLAAVRQVYGRLRRAEREVLALCVWAGLDYGQAAEALGVPVGTVRSRLSRARARLARLTDERLRAERAEDPEDAGKAGNAGKAENAACTEPGRGRGEVRGEAVFTARPLKEIQEGTR